MFPYNRRLIYFIIGIEFFSFSHAADKAPDPSIFNRPLPSAAADLISYKAELDKFLDRSNPEVRVFLQKFPNGWESKLAAFKTQDPFSVYKKWYEERYAPVGSPAAGGGMFMGAVVAKALEEERAEAAAKKAQLQMAVAREARATKEADERTSRAELLAQEVAEWAAKLSAFQQTIRQAKEAFDAVEKKRLAQEAAAAEEKRLALEKKAKEDQLAAAKREQDLKEEHKATQRQLARTQKAAANVTQGLLSDKAQKICQLLAMGIEVISCEVNPTDLSISVTYNHPKEGEKKAKVEFDNEEEFEEVQTILSLHMQSKVARIASAGVDDLTHQVLLAGVVQQHDRDQITGLKERIDALNALLEFLKKKTESIAPSLPLKDFLNIRFMDVESVLAQKKKFREELKAIVDTIPSEWPATKCFIDKLMSSIDLPIEKPFSYEDILSVFEEHGLLLDPNFEENELRKSLEGVGRIIEDMETDLQKNASSFLKKEETASAFKTVKEQISQFRPQYPDFFEKMNSQKGWPILAQNALIAEKRLRGKIEEFNEKKKKRASVSLAFQDKGLATPSLKLLAQKATLGHSDRSLVSSLKAVLFLMQKFAPSEFAQARKMSILSPDRPLTIQDPSSEPQGLSLEAQGLLFQYYGGPCANIRKELMDLKTFKISEDLNSIRNSENMLIVHHYLKFLIGEGDKPSCDVGNAKKELGLPVDVSSVKESLMLNVGGLLSGQGPSTIKAGDRACVLAILEACRFIDDSRLRETVLYSVLNMNPLQTEEDKLSFVEIYLELQALKRERELFSKEVSLTRDQINKAIREEKKKETDKQSLGYIALCEKAKQMKDQERGEFWNNTTMIKAHEDLRFWLSGGKGVKGSADSAQRETMLQMARWNYRFLEIARKSGKAVADLPVLPLQVRAHAAELNKAYQSMPPAPSSISTSLDDRDRLSLFFKQIASAHVEQDKLVNLLQEMGGLKSEYERSYEAFRKTLKQFGSLKAQAEALRNKVSASHAVSDHEKDRKATVMAFFNKLCNRLDESSDFLEIEADNTGALVVPGAPQPKRSSEVKVGSSVLDFEAVCRTTSFHSIDRAARILHLFILNIPSSSEFQHSDRLLKEMGLDESTFDQEIVEDVRLARESAQALWTQLSAFFEIIERFQAQKNLLNKKEGEDFDFYSSMLQLAALSSTEGCAPMAAPVGKAPPPPPAAKGPPSQPLSGTKIPAAQPPGPPPPPPPPGGVGVAGKTMPPPPAAKGPPGPPPPPPPPGGVGVAGKTMPPPPAAKGPPGPPPPPPPPGGVGVAGKTMPPPPPPPPPPGKTMAAPAVGTNSLVGSVNDAEIPDSFYSSDIAILTAFEGTDKAIKENKDPLFNPLVRYQSFLDAQVAYFKLIDSSRIDARQASNFVKQLTACLDLYLKMKVCGLESKGVEKSAKLQVKRVFSTFKTSFFKERDHSFANSCKLYRVPNAVTDDIFAPLTGFIRIAHPDLKRIIGNAMTNLFSNFDSSATSVDVITPILLDIDDYLGALPLFSKSEIESADDFNTFFLLDARK